MAQTLDVLADERFVMRVVADTFRQDLLDSRIGPGSHGCFIPLEALGANQIRWSVSGSQNMA